MSDDPNEPDEPQDGGASEAGDLDVLDELAARRKIPAPPMPEPPPGGIAVAAQLETERLHGDSKDPMRLAELYAAHRCVAFEQYSVVRWARSWWIYRDSFFVKLDEDTLKADIWRLLDRVDIEVKRKTEDGSFETGYEKLVVRSGIVREVLAALASILPAFDGDAPQWRYGRRFEPGPDGLLEREPDPVHVVACKNGVFDLRKRTLRAPNPRLFITHGVNARWREHAECPAWMAFLRSLWGEDGDAIGTLQEVFGYLMTCDTSQQKIFGLFGPSRSGKGTIARVLKALLGAAAVANPTLGSLGETFGMQPLIGKTVAIIGDARLSGKSDPAAITERLLSISGEDPQDVNCKNAAHVNVRLRARFLLISNELPALQDASMAFASRFVFLRTTESFYGRENLSLEERLLDELDGILRWAIDGWALLQERGYFVQPKSGVDLTQAMAISSSPMKAFLDDCCTLGDELEIDVKELFGRWKEWCSDNGHKNVGTSQSLGLRLRAAAGKVQVAQNRLPTGKRVRVYRGVGLA